MNSLINNDKVLVAYLDILGYSDLVQGAGEAGSYFKVINSAVSKWKYSIGDGQFQKYLIISIMSDSIVIAFDYKSLRQEEEQEYASALGPIMLFLYLISWICYDLMIGIRRPVRGSIVIGKFFSSRFTDLDGSMFVYSEALSRAYMIQKDESIYPRVVLSKELEFMCNSILIDNGGPFVPIFKDNDGLWYLNFFLSFGGGPHSLDENLDILYHCLKTEGIFITDMCKLYANNRKIIQKYNWLVNYHNNIIERAIKQDTNRQEINDRWEPLKIVLK